MTDTIELPLRDQVALWRQKAAEGTLTLEEQREAIKAIRAGRVGAAAASAKARSPKVPVDSQSLLDELENL